MSDHELLNAFTSRGDAESFRLLVERYTPLVYAGARRQVRDAHLAEDVTQAVFILLARKAKSVHGGAALAGWLVNATRHCARTALRGEARRKARETQAAGMKTSPEQQPMSPNAPGEIDDRIDDALCRLGEADRTAVTLRYLDGKSQREVAGAMGVSEAAAAQRISRAMSRLRKFFQGRGQMLSVAALGDAMHRQLHLAAPQPPAHLAGSASGAALQGGAASPMASAIADEAAASMRRAALVAAVATTALVSTLAVAVAGIVLMIASGRHDGSYATTQPGSPSAAVAKGPIRVGIYVSAKTAIPRPPRENAWFAQFQIADELKSDPDIELIPVIEPGTAEQPQQKRLMGMYCPGKSPIDVTDSAALRRLDVIVAASVHGPPLEALESIERAVMDGTGLFVRRCLGNHNPTALNPVSWRLRGLATTAPNTSAVGTPAQWVIVQGHPILGSLTPTSLPKPINRRVAGEWGLLPPGVGVPLIRLRRVERLTPGGAMTTTRPVLTEKDTTGDIVYLSGLGKGRIVSCNFWAETPPEIQEATDNRFTILAVKWLAGREVK